MPATLFGQDGQDLEPTADILVTRPDLDPKSFVYSAVVLLVAASIAVAAFRHFGIGSVLGLLVAGIFIGPHTPGPSVISHVEDVRHFTELGVLLLFLIGLEMHARHVVVIVVIKILVLLALCMLFREGRNAALRVALLLARSGEFGFRPVRCRQGARDHRQRHLRAYHWRYLAHHVGDAPASRPCGKFGYPQSAADEPR